MKLKTEKKREFSKEGWETYKKEIRKIDIKKIKSLKEITEIMINIGKKHFKIDNNIDKNKPRKPCWNQKCKEAIKQRNKTFNKWRKNLNE